MEHQKIFATNIFLLDNFIPQVTASEVSAVITMKKYISEMWSQRDYDDNWQKWDLISVQEYLKLI